MISYVTQLLLQNYNNLSLHYFSKVSYLTQFKNAVTSQKIYIIYKVFNVCLQYLLSNFIFYNVSQKKYQERDDNPSSLPLLTNQKYSTISQYPRILVSSCAEHVLLWGS